MDEPVTVPYLEARTEVRQDVHLVRRLDRETVTSDLDVVQ